MKIRKQRKNNKAYPLRGDNRYKPKAQYLIL